jgi:adenosylmethionine-8-amino-7-oxononanoate aminotransferase
LGAAGAAEATLEALSGLDHDGFALQLQEMMSDLSAEAITEGSLGALRLSNLQPRSLVERACLDEGLLIHLPTVVAEVDNLIVAPPLTSDLATIHELNKRLRRVLHRLNVQS